MQVNGFRGQLAWSCTGREKSDNKAENIRARIADRGRRLRRATIADALLARGDEVVSVDLMLPKLSS